MGASKRQDFLDIWSYFVRINHKNLTFTTLMKLKEERTLILIKPDAVKRGIAGNILQRMEQRGLKIIGLKMVKPSIGLIEKHYPENDKQRIAMGTKTLETYERYNIDPSAELGTADPLKIGMMIEGWNKEYISSGPVVAAVLSGIHAVDVVRKIAGNTLPFKADMGTIRGDYSIDSPLLANKNKRAIRNVLHASGNVEEAEHEIDLWFKKDELYFYKTGHEDIMF